VSATGRCGEESYAMLLRWDCNFGRGDRPKILATVEGKEKKKGRRALCCRMTKKELKTTGPKEKRRIQSGKEK